MEEGIPERGCLHIGKREYHCEGGSGRRGSAERIRGCAVAGKCGEPAAAGDLFPERCRREPSGRAVGGSGQSSEQADGAAEPAEQPADADCTDADGTAGGAAGGADL